MSFTQFQGADLLRFGYIDLERIVGTNNKRLQLRGVHFVLKMLTIMQLLYINNVRFVCLFLCVPPPSPFLCGGLVDLF